METAGGRERGDGSKGRGTQNTQHRGTITKGETETQSRRDSGGERERDMQTRAWRAGEVVSLKEELTN